MTKLHRVEQRELRLQEEDDGTLTLFTSLEFMAGEKIGQQIVVKRKVKKV